MTIASQIGGDEQYLPEYQNYNVKSETLLSSKSIYIYSSKYKLINKYITCIRDNMQVCVDLAVKNQAMSNQAILNQGYGSLSSGR